eukprot:6713963-Pyramimonas_sp.AAC.1
MAVPWLICPALPAVLRQRRPTIRGCFALCGIARSRRPCATADATSAPQRHNGTLSHWVGFGRGGRGSQGRGPQGQ